MPEDSKTPYHGVGDTTPPPPQSEGQLESDNLPPRRPRHITHDMAVDRTSVKSTLISDSHKSFKNQGSNQFIVRVSKDERLRLAQLDIKDRLNKVDSGLRVLKARLKTKEEKLTSRYDMPKNIMTAEQKLKVKIEKAKEELSAKEDLAAARRTKKHGMRDEWAKKQKVDYQQREAKRREQAKTDIGAEMASAGAAMATSCEGDFDIDVYDN
ncbi:unnamed protein product [Alternaria alternata]